MTKQEIFDKVAPKLLRQNEKCGVQGEVRFQCMYKQDNKRCAVGFLIPDGHPALEANTGVYLLSDNFPDLGFRDNKYFLMELQGIHDANETTYWKPLLLEIAKRYQLSTECISDV